MTLEVPTGPPLPRLSVVLLTDAVAGGGGPRPPVWPQYRAEAGALVGCSPVPPRSLGDAVGLSSTAVPTEEDT